MRPLSPLNSDEGLAKPVQAHLPCPMDFVYAVLLRYRTGTLRGIGVHTFSEPLFVGGPAVLDNDDVWTVVELRMDESPPVAVVERVEA